MKLLKTAGILHVSSEILLAGDKKNMKLSQSWNIDKHDAKDRVTWRTSVKTATKPYKPGLKERLS